MLRTWCSLLAGMALVLLGGSGCQHRYGGAGPAEPDSVQGPRPVHTSWEARFTMIEDGQRRAIIRADRMEQYRAADSSYSIWRTQTDTTRVRSFIFEKGDSSATIIADSVVFFGQEGRFEAYGDVRVRTQEQKRLFSEHLTWNQVDRTIRTRRFVRIITPTERVQGNGLVADENLETYQIGRFSAEVDVEEENDGE